MNKYLKFSLFTTTILVALAIAFIVGTTYGSNDAKSTKNSQETAKAEATPPTRAELLKLVNAERKKVGVAPLKEDKRLDASAQAKANDMVVHGYGHECPHCLNGMLTAEKAMSEKRGNYSENLDENTDAKTAVAAWVKSKPHYTAMVNPRYTLTGFGIAGKDKDGYYLFVEHFYSPQVFTTPTTKQFN